MKSHSGKLVIGKLVPIHSGNLVPIHSGKLVIYSRLLSE